ncbi:hypothetical protein [Nitrospirillum viridazoti]|uniref:Uncharacterized protein n=1 Tax=Nitrospirillum viridazoti CBAmc TaxID=1441467 RepID=A0A248JSC5_9PROT|nr:hypothetical protein [Nitrospirillum amazonense]ASG21381.1 hypothetical protein Y958_11500 [Nitrospirillum amazonense CBAmc]TWB33058.1 hypothetical protein FBZ91_115120 [Nitrospirillum amazonense]
MTQRGHNRGPEAPPAECLECGGDYTRVRHDQNFCSDFCRKSWNARRKERGLAIFDAAYDWIANRRGSALTMLSRLLRQMAREDRERRAANKAAADRVKAAKLAGD